MKQIVIDIDEVLCNSDYLKIINDYFKKDYKLEDFTDYFIDFIYGSEEELKKFYEHYQTFDGYRNSELFKAAYETILKLSKENEIFICSAYIMPYCEEISYKFAIDKYKFLIRTLPFISPHNFIFTSSKHLLNADVIIDDKLSNLNGKIKTKLLMTAYHNKNIDDKTLKELNIIRVNSWAEIAKILL